MGWGVRQPTSSSPRVPGSSCPVAPRSRWLRLPTRSATTRRTSSRTTPTRRHPPGCVAEAQLPVGPPRRRARSASAGHRSGLVSDGQRRTSGRPRSRACSSAPSGSAREVSAVAAVRAGLSRSCCPPACAPRCPAMAVSNGLRPGLAMVTKQLADELGPAGIRVNGLLPGRVATERLTELDALSGDPAAAKAASLRDDPAGSVRRAVRARPCRGVPAQPGRVVPHRRHAPGRRGMTPGPVSAHAGRAQVGPRRLLGRLLGTAPVRRGRWPPPTRGSRTRRGRAGRRTTTAGHRRSGVRC